MLPPSPSRRSSARVAHQRRRRRRAKRWGANSRRGGGRCDRVFCDRLVALVHVVAGGTRARRAGPNLKARGRGGHTDTHTQLLLPRVGLSHLKNDAPPALGSPSRDELRCGTPHIVCASVRTLESGSVDGRRVGTKTLLCVFVRGGRASPVNVSFGSTCRCDSDCYVCWFQGSRWPRDSGCASRGRRRRRLGARERRPRGGYWRGALRFAPRENASRQRTQSQPKLQIHPITTSTSTSSATASRARILGRERAECDDNKPIETTLSPRARARVRAAN